jgi:FtsH-binding integral membrane protein
MLFLEYFVLIRLYDRNDNLKSISLVIAASMIILSVILGRFIFKKHPTITQIFLIVAYMELPLSIYGYKLIPDATIFERVIIAGTFGAISFALSEAILSKKKLYKF